MASPVSGITFHIKEISVNQTLFRCACSDIVRQAQQGRMTQLEAQEASIKIETAFKEVLASIDMIKPFLIDGETVKAEAEEHFFKITKIDETVRKSFVKAMTSLQGIDPSLAVKTTELFSGQKEESVSYLHVYYDGPGDLYIRGQGAHIRLPAQKSNSLSHRMDIGETKQLSWDSGIPLKREANHLWKAVLVADENGTPPHYKFLISDCVWSTGPDYSPGAKKSTIHVPAFDETSASLLVPMDVGFGNKLLLLGKGEVLIEKYPVELSWEKGIDFTNFGPHLWVLSFKAKGEVEFKICIAKESGELIWEIGEKNRKLSTGQELVVTPNFGPGIGRVETMELASSNLGLHLLNQQEFLQEELKEKSKQKKAQIENRPIPCLLKTFNAKTFSDKAIVQVNDCVKIEDKIIDGKEFHFYYTKNNKTIIIQEAPEGCTAGASAMLIIDNGRTPKAADLLNRKAASYDQIAKDIQNAGLEALTVQVATYGRSMEKLKDQIKLHGPAYVRIKENNGGVGHAILVDEISEDLSKVRIRDPWHAWEVIVYGADFKKAWYCSLDQAEADDYTVQVKNGVK
jgi:hypothetical protein